MHTTRKHWSRLVDRIMSRLDVGYRDVSPILAIQLCAATCFEAMVGVYVRKVDNAGFGVTQEILGVRITHGRCAR